MCQLCVREMDAATGMLDDLIRSYKQDIEADLFGEQDDTQRFMALAGVMNHSVREHYGVLNGQMVAIAIHRFATGNITYDVAITDEQAQLAIMTINEKRRAEGRTDLLTTESLTEILDVVLNLVT